jgi:hypothetical protein
MLDATTQLPGSPSAFKHGDNADHSGRQNKRCDDGRMGGKEDATLYDTRDEGVYMLGGFRC